MKQAIIILAAISINAFAGDYEGQLSTNPYATPKAQIQSGRTYQLRTTDGEYRGTIGEGRYAPDSTSNPYGRYGSKYSPDSINNPYGAGSRYNSDSPSNPYGRGLEVYGD